MRQHLAKAAAAVILWAIPLTGAPEASKVSAIDERRLTAEEFPLMAWNVAEGDRAEFERMHDCGFNLAGFVRPEHLDAVAKAGLKCFVYDPHSFVSDEAAALSDAEIDLRVRAIVDTVGQHPAVFGYYLRDEPGARIFPGLSKWAHAFMLASPGKLPYVNLFPNYASVQQIEATDYDRYLHTFASTVALPYLSFDHYPLQQDGTIRKEYFANLEAVRNVARTHQTCFWSVALSTGCLNSAEPSEAGLHFQAYSSLAYGVRGLSWFTYFTPGVGSFRLGPIDQFGGKTATWDALRRVNLQIHRLGSAYLQLRSVNVFHHGEVPQGCRTTDTSKYLEHLEGGNFVVGEFESDTDRPHVLVVNKDLQRAVTVAVRFKTAGMAFQVNAYTGQLVPFNQEQNWLAPGQGVLLCLVPATRNRTAAR